MENFLTIPASYSACCDSKQSQRYSTLKSMPRRVFFSSFLNYQWLLLLLMDRILHPSWHLKSVRQLAIPPCWLCGCHQLGGIPDHPTIQHKEGCNLCWPFLLFEKQLATINRFLFNDIVVWIITMKDTVRLRCRTVSFIVISKKALQAAWFLDTPKKFNWLASSGVYDGVQRMVCPAYHSMPFKLGRPETPVSCL